MQGVGKVTAVGSKVSGISVNDHVIPKKSFGAFRPAVKAQADALVKVPTDIPYEYAAILRAPLTAFQLLKGVQPGQTIIHSGADTLVGQAIVQMATARGIKTVSIVQKSTDEEETVDILKNLGSFLVLMPELVGNRRKFKDFTSDVATPALGIYHAEKFFNPNLVEAFRTATKYSERRDLVESAHALDLVKLKVANTMKGFPVKSYGPNASKANGGFVVEDWLASAPASEVEAAVSEVSGMIKGHELSLWVENYPMEDLEFASKKISEVFPGYRAPVLKFCVAEDLEKFGDKFGHGFSAVPNEPMYNGSPYKNFEVWN